jgi:hypothetical protein
MSKSFLDAYEDYADARETARRERPRELQLLVAATTVEGLSLRAVIDGKEQDFFVSRETAASIIGTLAKALAYQNQD